jgi:hypothetical protein
MLASKCRSRRLVSASVVFAFEGSESENAKVWSGE